MLSSFTPAGEGDPACGMPFVNMVHDALTRHDGHHLVMAEPHHQITQHPNYYRQAGWKPVLGGMRTYYRIDSPQPPESVGVEFKLAAMGDIFMGEGCFYGFLGGNHQYMNPEMPIDSYRRRVRETIYTGLAHRNPILLTWEERIVEDERMVFEQIRQAVDWSTPFQRPPLAIRVDGKLMPVAGRQPLFRYEKRALANPARSLLRVGRRAGAARAPWRRSTRVSRLSSRPLSPTAVRCPTNSSRVCRWSCRPVGRPTTPGAKTAARCWLSCEGWTRPNGSGTRAEGGDGAARTRRWSFTTSPRRCWLSNFSTWPRVDPRSKATSSKLGT